MKPGIPMEVLTALSRFEEPLCSTSLLEYVPSAATGTDVCRAIYDLRRSGYIEERGSVPSKSKMGKPLRTYAITPAGLDQLAPAEPAAAPSSAPLPAGADADRVPGADQGQAAVAEVRRQDLCDPVMQAISGLGRPALLLYQSDMDRLRALADSPLCDGALGAWLNDLARRIGQELQP